MQIGMNLAQYDFYSGIELLPAADYPVVIEDVVAERASNPASGLLKLTLTVAQGHPNAGRKVFYRLNIWNISDDAKAIAYKQLKTLCFAVGITGMLNTEDELKGRQCIVSVTNDGTYNNVKLVKDMQGNIPGKAPVTQMQANQPAMTTFGGQSNAGPTAFTPAGAVPAGFNPGAPAPGSFAPPTQFQQPAYQQQPGPQAGNPFEPSNAPQQGMQTQFQQPPQGAPWNGGGQPQQPNQYQPQAQAPANPGAQFQPAQQQQQPPAGWPHQ